MQLRIGVAAFVAAVVAAASWGGLACSSPSGSDGGVDGGADGPADGAPPRDGPLDGTTDSATDAPDAPLPDAGSGPALVAMSLSSGGGPDASPTAVQLYPPFSPIVHDYYVRCAAGTNAFELSMTASSHATSHLTKPTASPSAHSQMLAVSVPEGEAIVAVAAKGATSVEYWVRCLPHDFPEMDWTLHPDAGSPAPGYYMLANQTQGSGASGYAMILDVNGVPVWFVKNPGGGIYVDVDDVVPGALSFLLYPQTPGQIAIHTLSPPSTQYIAPNVGSDISRHELRYLKNGHYLAIIPPNKYDVDLTGARLTFSDGGSIPLGNHMTIQDCEIVEFDETGALYSWWFASEHMDVAKETVAPLLAGIQSDGGLVMDPIHCNSIDIDPTDDTKMLVSAKCTDSVSYVDRIGGRILWKMGGKKYSKDDAVILPVADPFHSQHDARFLPDWSSTCAGGSGKVSVFDDETTTKNPARGVVYDVTVGPYDASLPADAGDAGDSSSGGAVDCGVTGASPSATVNWEYQGTHNSSGMGSFRVLSDGSRVIGWGQDNVPNLVFTELVGDSDILDLYFTQGFTSYRVIKAAPTAFDLEVLRTTAGQP